MAIQYRFTLLQAQNPIIVIIFFFFLDYWWIWSTESALVPKSVIQVIFTGNSAQFVCYRVGIHQFKLLVLIVRSMGSFIWEFPHLYLVFLYQQLSIHDTKSVLCDLTILEIDVPWNKKKNHPALLLKSIHHDFLTYHLINFIVSLIFFSDSITGLMTLESDV